MPIEVPGYQLDRRCGSGLQAVLTAAQSIRAGEHSLVVAGGVGQLKGTVIAAWAVGVATAFLTDWTSGSMAQVLTFALVTVLTRGLGAAGASGAEGGV